jgi:amino acid transporter/nucleotide-binding universal stress UspA family protein
MVRAANVIIVGSVMFTFISYWRTAAVVLCDLASTAYYIGGIVEQAIGPAAPWFILAVMLFSYAVRSVYIESSSMFVRGGVYRVVKEAMGGFLAKVSVSALMFDYILTGPTSGVSAGQYIMGLLLETVKITQPSLYVQLGFANDETRKLWLNTGAVLLACGVTLYFFRQNLIGIHESSEKALKIMIAMTVMAVVMLTWCLITLAVRGPVNSVPFLPDLSPKVEYQSTTLGRLSREGLNRLRGNNLPEAVLTKLDSIVDREFNTTEDLDYFLETDLLSKEEYGAFHQRIVEQARVVDHYELQPDAVGNLVATGKLPESVANELKPLYRNSYPSLADFDEALNARLNAEQYQKYALLLTGTAEVLLARDRVNGDLQAMSARDPRTGKLIPASDEDGKPTEKINPATGHQEDPLGFIPALWPDLAKRLREPGSWFSIIGVIGLFIAFGHSILAMSGEETLAQVYREVESPKLPNFKKAAFIVFVYSLALTASISFLAVLLIPNEVRMLNYSDNLIGGLSMYVIGPAIARLLLNAFVVFVGSLILAGAVNTAIIGSNGVLNRVSEDGVLPDWFLKPHPHYGTTYRLLYLIVGLQLFTIVASRGNMYVLGEAYAFGVVWSFVFKAAAMVVLRFKDQRPREFKVPLNIRVGNYEIPLGLGLIFVVLLITAVMNFLTKEVATVGGVIFTIVFLTVFMISEWYHERLLHGAHHEHLEQFNKQTTDEISPESLHLTKHYRKLVAIRSTQNLFMLEKALAETDPETTGVVVMTAKLMPTGDNAPDHLTLDKYDQQLMTAVVQKAEKAGKQVKPMILPTNNPLFAVIKTTHDLHAHELIMGASNKYTADEQLEQIAFYWISMHNGEPAPLTVRILGRDRDVYLDLGGGNRIPKISERKARSVAELRAAGVGVDRVLLIHDGSPACSDLFQAVLTSLDPEVHLDVVPVVPVGKEPLNGHNIIHQDEERAKQLDRPLTVHHYEGDPTTEILRVARETEADLIIIPLPQEMSAGAPLCLDERTLAIIRDSHKRVFLAAPATIPQEPEEQPTGTPSH